MMPEFIIEYIVTQVRLARVTAVSEANATQEIKDWHEQIQSERMAESVIINTVERD
jgi:hypothetical protein